jgi:AcrR family transcriptional regulator
MNASGPETPTPPLNRHAGENRNSLTARPSRDEMKVSTYILRTVKVEYSGKAFDILTAARDLFTQKGLGATTTKEIAARAGANEITLFRYFKSKDNLFEAVFDYFCFTPDYASLNDIERESLESYLRKIGQFFQTIVSRNEGLIIIELRDRSAIEAKRIIDRFQNNIKDRMTRYVAQNKGLTAREAELFAVSYLSSLFGILMNLTIFHTYSTEVTFDDCLELLIRHYS